MTKLDQTYTEDYVLYVSEHDERETLRTLGFSSQNKESVLESNPYQLEGWDD